MRDYISYGCSYYVSRVDVTSEEVDVLIPYSVDEPKTFLPFLSPYIIFGESIIKRLDLQRWTINFKMLVNENICGSANDEFARVGDTRNIPGSAVVQLPHLYLDDSTLHVTDDACTEAERDAQRDREAARRQAAIDEAEEIVTVARTQHENVPDSTNFSQELFAAIQLRFSQSPQLLRPGDRLALMAYIHLVFENVAAIYTEEVHPPIMMQIVSLFIYAQRLRQSSLSNISPIDQKTRDLFVSLSAIYSILYRLRTADPDGMDVSEDAQLLLGVESSKASIADRNTLVFSFPQIF